MKLTKHTRLIPILLITLLYSCSYINSNTQDLKIQHESLSKHFEDEANQNQIKLEEHQKLLNQLKSKKYVYGKHAEDLEKHNKEVINLYEKLITSNREMSQLLNEKH
jgi:hypothetical protein